MALKKLNMRNKATTTEYDVLPSCSYRAIPKGAAASWATGAAEVMEETAVAISLI